MANPDDDTIRIAYASELDSEELARRITDRIYSTLLNGEMLTQEELTDEVEAVLAGEELRDD